MAATVVVVVVAGVAFWLVRSTPARSFEAASAEFHADAEPVAEELRTTLEEITTSEGAADADALHERAAARAAALRDEYRDYRERLADVQFPSRAAAVSERLASAVNAGQLLMSVAASSDGAEDTVQVLTSWPSMDAAIADAEQDLREAL